MEYITKDGTKVIVEKNMVKYGEGKMRQNIIGANFTNGIKHGGYLSSFRDSFKDELIGIETGLGDIINTKIGDIKEAYEILKNKITNINKTDLLEISQAIIETVNEYFNGYDKIEERLNYYYSNDYEESKNNKISNLKNTGAAMCVERSVLAQNLLKSIGINSIYKTSGIIKNNNKEVHSYNLIEYENKYYIFDTSIPSLINDKINPLVAEIDEETFNKLSSPITDIGISVKVSHYNPYRDTTVEIIYDSGRKKEIEVKALGETKKQINK